MCEYSPATAELQRAAAAGGSEEDGSEDGDQRDGDGTADGLDSDPDRESARTVGNNGYGNFGKPLFGAKHGEEQQQQPPSGSRVQESGTYSKGG